MAKPTVVSVWTCDVCRTTVLVQGRPNRQRHAPCRHWMSCQAEIPRDPARVAEVRAALLGMARRQER